MADFYLKQGDTGPMIRGTVSVDDETVDITGAAVVFRYQSVEGGAATERVGVVVDAAAFVVGYQPTTDDTTTPGRYYFEFKTTLTSGKIVTFPNDGYLVLQVTSQLA